MATLIEEVLFSQEVAPHLSGEELDELNEELSAHLAGLETGSDEYFMAAREFTEARLPG